MIVKTAQLDELQGYTFVVVFCRYMDKWLYCRLEGSDAYGNAGGHIEPGETTFEAAKRELYEETGAIRYDIEPAFDYSVEQESGYTTGQVFLAHIHELGELGNYEIAEVKLFEAMPEEMRFPMILPVLYKRMQKYAG